MILRKIFLVSCSDIRFLGLLFRYWYSDVDPDLGAPISKKDGLHGLPSGHDVGGRSACCARNAARSAAVDMPMRCVGAAIAAISRELRGDRGDFARRRRRESKVQRRDLAEEIASLPAILAAMSDEAIRAKRARLEEVHRRFLWDAQYGQAYEAVREALEHRLGRGGGRSSRQARELRHPSRTADG